jgi:hypothetical protein
MAVLEIDSKDLGEPAPVIREGAAGRVGAGHPVGSWTRCPNPTTMDTHARRERLWNGESWNGESKQ